MHLNDALTGLIMKIKHTLSSQEELMVIMMEECGELIQQCSKAIRCQDFTKDELQDEIGDVMCMIEMCIEKGIVDKRTISNRIQVKRMKLLQWSNLS